MQQDEKFQVPNTKLQTKAKLQAAKWKKESHVFGFFSLLVGIHSVWIFDFGIWNLFGT